MEYRTFYCMALALIAANFGQVQSILLREKNLNDFRDNEVIRLMDPSDAKNSAIVLSYDLRSRDFFKRTYEKNVTLSAPQGYALFVTFSKLDLRPNSVDNLTLYIPGKNMGITYTNKKSSRDEMKWDKEDGRHFYSSNGKIQVLFKTVNADLFTMGYKGFAFTCTVQGDVNNPHTCKTDFFKCHNGKCIASALKCNKFIRHEYSHCGDRSDHTADACRRTLL